MQITSLFLCLLLGLLVRAQHDESEQQRAMSAENRPALPPIKRHKNPIQPNAGNYYFYQMQQQRTSPPGQSPQYYYVSLADYTGGMQQGNYHFPPSAYQPAYQQPPMMAPPAMDFGPQMPYYPPMSFMPSYQGMPVVPMTFQRGGTQLSKGEGGDSPKDENQDNAPASQPGDAPGNKGDQESVAEQQNQSDDDASSPGVPSRSGTPMFTNAHHYPFPQGLMQLYYQNYHHQSPAGNEPSKPAGNQQQVPVMYLYPSGSGTRYVGPSGEPLLPPIGLSGQSSGSSKSSLDNKPQQGPGFSSESAAKQTGKNSGDDDSPATPVHIYKYPMPGFSHLGDMYVPVYSSERGAPSNSRV